jgi:hypothetical protein
MCQVNNLARDMYRKALAMVEEEPLLRSVPGNVTQAAAHNLILLYRACGSIDHALAVMRTHLCLDG